MNDFLDQKFWGATVGDYCAFLGIILAALLLKKPFSRLLARISASIATRFSGGKYRTLFRSLIRKPLEWLFAVILFFYAFNFIEEPLNNVVLLHWHRKDQESIVYASRIIDHLFAFFAIVFTTLLLSRITDFLYRAQVGRAHQQLDRERAQLMPLIRDVVKIVLWTIGFFWMLGVVFHVNIPALITGLGIGGVALALAAKESLENLLASFTILADKPFSVADTVRLGTLEGKVERIGFRSTRLRTDDGSLLIIPNKKLVDESLENLSARASLHVRLTIPVKYSTPPQQPDQLLEQIRRSVSSIPEVHPPVQVAIESFTEAAFVLGLSYELSPSLAANDAALIKAKAAEHVYRAIIMPAAQD
jgi:MscS family membrane protein